MNDDDLTKTLNNIEVPNELASQLHKNFAEQLKQDEPLNKRRWLISSMIAASVLFLALILLPSIKRPIVVDAAFADLNYKEHIENGLQNQQALWLTANQLVQPISSIEIVASKFCNLAGIPTTHLTITTKAQQTFDIFFQSHLSKTSFIEQGNIDSQKNWRIIKTTGEMTAVILYDQDISETTVNNLVSQMMVNHQLNT